MRLISFAALFATLCVLCASSCTQDPLPEPPRTGTVPAEGVYYALTDSTQWTYTDENGLNEFTLTVVGDSTVGGVSYKKLKNSVTGTTTLVQSANNELRILTTVPNAAADSAVLRMLVDTMHLEKIWVDSILLADSTSQTLFLYDISSIEDVRLLQGVEYKDVLRVRRRNYLKTASLTAYQGTNYYWYAKDIGLIELDENNGSYFRLKSYQIR
jgi:hypothetical protein